MKSATKKVKSEFSFWYPANRQEDDPVLPGLDRYPVKRRRRVVVPMTSLGHITHNNKLLCEKTKRVAQRERECTTGKTTTTRLPAIDVCPKCLELYGRLAVSEIKKLKAWNNGEPRLL
jgi:hypothetical protein